MIVPLWTYNLIIVLFSLIITFILFIRWLKSKDYSLLYWGAGFLFFALSYVLSVLFVADLLPEYGLIYQLLHFLRQGFVSLFFLFVYLGITILVTKKRFWTRNFPAFFLALQLAVIGYYDFVGARILLAENFHIFLFDIPFNIVISALFMRYYIISSRRFSLLQSFAWFGYLIVVSIGFGVKFSLFFYTVSLIPMLVMLIGFIDYYKRPLTEHILEITPRIEDRLSNKKLKYVLKPGRVYIVKEPKPHKSFDMFADYVKHKYYGLAISRTNPKIIRKKIGLKLTPLIWLTRIDTTMKYLNPLELEQLTYVMSDFIAKVGDKKSIILLDGLEYLATSNEFVKVLHAISMIKDKVSSSRCIMLIPLQGKALAGKDLVMLERELE